ncbi:MAG: YciI-like protein [Candidatus Acidiferrum sp.]
MTYFALIYDLVDDMVNRRVPYRDAHLGLARDAQARGHLLLGGAFNPPDRALLVFRAADQGPVEEFVRQDPYVANGLVKRWEIRPWTVVVGNE